MFTAACAWKDIRRTRVNSNTKLTIVKIVSSATTSTITGFSRNTATRMVASINKWSAFSDREAFQRTDGRFVFISARHLRRKRTYSIRAQENVIVLFCFSKSVYQVKGVEQFE